jgi:hypothetical protein
MADKGKCFVIAPIGAAGTDIRMRSDQILKYIIRPVAEECGYGAVRADEITEPGIITTQVIDHVLNDAMVVADLTGNNANVFYELAIRHAIRKPYVQIIQKGERIPFDVAGVRTIEIDHQNLDSVEQAKEEMKKQMRYTAEHPEKIESPISVAVDSETLKRSSDPEKRQLGEILSGIAELKQLVQSKGTLFPYGDLLFTAVPGNWQSDEWTGKAISYSDMAKLRNTSMHLPGALGAVVRAKVRRETEIKKKAESRRDEGDGPE